MSKFWSRFTKPVLVLHCEKDEFVPGHVDQVALNKKYREANSNVSSLSGFVPGTGHTVLQEEARDWLGKRVVQFLESV